MDELAKHKGIADGYIPMRGVEWQVSSNNTEHRSEISTNMSFSTSRSKLK